MSIAATWTRYPKNKPPIIGGWYLCHDGDTTYMLNQWAGRRWKYANSAPVEWWMALPAPPTVQGATLLRRLGEPSGTHNPTD